MGKIKKKIDSNKENNKGECSTKLTSCIVKQKHFLLKKTH